MKKPLANQAAQIHRKLEYGLFCQAGLVCPCKEAQPEMASKSVLKHGHGHKSQGTGAEGAPSVSSCIFIFFQERVMAHKKVERRKELDRRRKRRAERIKLKIKEARANAAS